MRATLHPRYLFTAVLALTILLTVQVQANEQSENEAQQVVSVTDLRGYHEFDYTFEDRPDPFLPFFDTKETPETRKIDPHEILTELQKFEPGQLKLVAVMAFKDKTIAMLEDVTGKGHPVEQGMAIGRNGIITSIEPNVLLVTESYETTTGRKIVNKIPLHMQPKE